MSSALSTDDCNNCQSHSSASMDPKHEPRATHSPEASASRPSLCYLFLDIDGVLNRIEDDDDEFPSSSSCESEDGDGDDSSSEKQKEKKKKKHKKKKRKKERKKQHKKLKKSSQDAPSNPSSSEESVSLLPCVPSLDRIRLLLQQSQLESSIDAQLLQHLCHCIHYYTCNSGGTSSSSTSSPAAIATPASSSVASPSSCASRRVQIVLTSTWRLQPSSLASLTQLLQQLSLVAISDHTAAASSSSPDSALEAEPAAFSASSLTPCFSALPLLITPDLKGWATRLEEIYAFFQQPQHTLCDEFVIVDDMNMYPALSLPSQCQMDVTGQLSSLSVKSDVGTELAYACYYRTIKLEGTRGLDASSVPYLVRALHNPNTSFCLPQFLAKVKTYQLPTPPGSD